jgi:hypothetical protein
MAAEDAPLHTSRMRRTAVVVSLVGFLLAAMVASAAGASAVAPTRAGSATATGNDVSWPQCGRTLPSGQAFGIVGVNNGLANNFNPCFASQLSWAEASSGGTSMPKAALYVNTANPALTGSWWPTDNTYPMGSPVAVPARYGTCRHDDGPACAYVYGYAKAYDDVAAVAAGGHHPASYDWWLDVETSNSWEGSTTSNRADLEGMTDYLDSQGIRVGVYSTAYQWKTIVGAVGAVGTSSLDGLPSWIAGARNLKGAQANCATTPLTGGKIVVTQYVSGSFDYDYSCT